MLPFEYHLNRQYSSHNPYQYPHTNHNNLLIRYVTVKQCFLVDPRFKEFFCQTMVQGMFLSTLSVAEQTGKNFMNVAEGRFSKFCL